MHPIFKITGKLSPLFRRRRMRLFLETFQPDRNCRILDLGGLPRFWEGVSMPARLTILNLHELDAYDRSFMTPLQEAVTGDATGLEYEDGEFDIVFSNSVIEHLGTAEKQAAFAREARRVGKSYWIQTPAKEFVLEPHYVAAFVHWFPKRVQRHLVRNFSLWGLLGHPSKAVIESVLAELRLLTRGEFARLFSESRIYVERVLGLPKSYTAFKLQDQTSCPGSHFPPNDLAIPASGP